MRDQSYQIYIVAEFSPTKLFLDGTATEFMTLDQAIMFARENASPYPCDTWTTPKIIYVCHKDSNDPCYSVYNLNGKFIESHA